MQSLTIFHTGDTPSARAENRLTMMNTTQLNGQRRNTANEFLGLMRTRFKGAQTCSSFDSVCCGDTSSPDLTVLIYCMNELKTTHLFLHLQVTKQTCLFKQIVNLHHPIQDASKQYFLYTVTWRSSNVLHWANSLEMSQVIWYLINLIKLFLTRGNSATLSSETDLII